MSDTNTVAITAFPMDSKVESFGEDGLPVYDRAFSSADLRNFIGATYNNGYFADTADSLKPTLAVVGGEEHSGYVTEPVAYISLAAGTVCINGVLGFIPDETVLTPVNDVADGSSAAVVARLNLAEGKRNIEVTFGVENAITNDKNALTIAVATRSGNSFTLTDYRGQAGYCPEVVRRVQPSSAEFLVSTTPLEPRFLLDKAVPIDSLSRPGTYFMPGNPFTMLPKSESYKYGATKAVLGDNSGYWLDSFTLYPENIRPQFGAVHLASMGVSGLCITGGRYTLLNINTPAHAPYFYNLGQVGEEPTSEPPYLVAANCLSVEVAYSFSSLYASEGFFTHLVHIPLGDMSTWKASKEDFTLDGELYKKREASIEVSLNLFEVDGRSTLKVFPTVWRFRAMLTRWPIKRSFDKPPDSAADHFNLRLDAERIDATSSPAPSTGELYFKRAWLE